MNIPTQYPITNYQLFMITNSCLLFLSLALCGCAAMHSSSLTLPTISKGVVYHLPKSYYRLNIGGGSAESPKIEVSHDIQPDNVSFTLDISRNPLVDRKQTYGVNEKGLLTSAKTEDTGRVTELLESVASTIVALGQPGVSGTMPGAGAAAAAVAGRPIDNNQLSVDEYKIFYEELSKMNYKMVCASGDSLSERIPSPSGNFIVTFTPPKDLGTPLGTKAIRASLVDAGARSKKVVRGTQIDEQILAAGVIARPITYAQMSYSIYVHMDAVNRIRTGGKPKADEDKAKSAFENQKSANQKDQDKFDKLKTDKEVLTAKNAAEAQKIAVVAAAAKSMEKIIEAVQSSTATGKTSLSSFHTSNLGFDKSDEYWAKYSELLESLQADSAQDSNLKKSQVSKVIAMNVVVQQLANRAMNAANERIAANNEKIGELDAFSNDWTDTQRKNTEKLNKLKYDLDMARSGTALATQNIPIVITTDRMPLVDRASAQVIPLRRSMIDKVTSDVTMVNGVVTAHSIDEPSEVLGTVKIPLKVIEAVLDTANTLWTKKGNTQSSENAYLEAQRKYIEARKALDEAKKEKDE